MKIYRIEASDQTYQHETWLISARSLLEAVTRAEARLKRTPRAYEGWKLTEAAESKGLFLGKE